MGRQLKGITGPNLGTSYKYNENGLRTEKTVNGRTHEYTLLGSSVTREVSRNEQGEIIWTLRYSYAGDTSPVSMNVNGTEYYYLKNAQGDITHIVDGEDSEVAAYEYDAWGNHLKVVGGEIAQLNPYRYRGYRYDEETGFYYLESRYYSPEWGRFINADNAISGVGVDFRGYNLYAYCMNNPASMSDPNGHWPQWIQSVANAVANTVKMAATVIVEVVKSIVSSATKPALSSVKTPPKSLPKVGKPNSDKILPNPDGTPKQKRWYGPDGNAERDRDYNHPGNVPFPHDHDWANGERNKDHLPPDPAYEFSLGPLLGVGLIVVCTLGIVLVAGNDITGVGVIDDFLLGPLGSGVGEGLIMIFGQ